jgi:hypothetical protein
VQIDKKKKGFSFSKSAETLTGIELPFLPKVGTRSKKISIKFVI